MGQFLKAGKTVPIALPAIAILCFLIIGACSLPFGNQGDPEQNSDGSSRSLVSPGGFGSAVYAPDSRGYLKTNTAGKRFMHLEGSGYAMGYQHGYLIPESVRRMASEDFVVAVLSNFLNLTSEEFRAKVGQLVIDGLMAAFKTKSNSLISEIPAEYIDELRGIVDGAAARGVTVNYDHLLVINTAFDVLLGVAYPIIAPLLGLDILTPHMCDGFIVNGKGTTDGRTLMGRNFMFTDRFIHEETLLVEYVPSSGYRFVTPNLAGWVGLVSGMNVKGVGIGCDMAPSVASKLSRVGMGVVLANRRALQYSSKLSEGVNSILNANLGVSWIVAIGSGLNEPGGAVIETASNGYRIRYMDYKYPFLYSLIPGMPKQIETKSDLVVFANHFIVPEMHLLALNPAFDDSRSRYETLTNLLLSNYGKIDVTKGKQFVNYLAPPASDYYGSDPDSAVQGSRTLFDLKNLEMWSLYGHYSDDWMNYKFQ